MAYISVDVDIDITDHLDEISTDELVEELKKRKAEKAVYNGIHTYKLFGAESLQDIMKVEAFINKYKDIPESELDAFLDQY